MPSCPLINKTSDSYSIKEFCIDNATILSALATITAIAATLIPLQVHGIIDFKSSFSSYAVTGTIIGGIVGAISTLAIKAFIEKRWHHDYVATDKVYTAFIKGYTEGAEIQKEPPSLENKKLENLKLKYKKFHTCLTFTRKHQKTILAIIGFLAITTIILLQCLNIIHLEKILKNHYYSIVVGAALGSITALVIKIFLEKNCAFFYKKSLKERQTYFHQKGLHQRWEDRGKYGDHFDASKHVVEYSLEILRSNRKRCCGC